MPLTKKAPATKSRAKKKSDPNRVTAADPATLADTKPKKGMAADDDSPVLDPITSRSVPEMMSMHYLLNFLTGATKNGVMANLNKIPHRQIGESLIFSKTAIRLYMEGSDSKTDVDGDAVDRTTNSSPSDQFTVADRQHLRTLLNTIKTLIDAPPVPGDSVNTTIVKVSE